MNLSDDNFLLRYIDQLMKSNNVGQDPVQEHNGMTEEKPQTESLNRRPQTETFWGRLSGQAFRAGSLGTSNS